MSIVIQNTGDKPERVFFRRSLGQWHLPVDLPPNHSVEIVDGSRLEIALRHPRPMPPGAPEENEIPPIKPIDAP